MQGPSARALQRGGEFLKKEIEGPRKYAAPWNHAIVELLDSPEVKMAKSGTKLHLGGAAVDVGGMAPVARILSMGLLVGREFENAYWPCKTGDTVVFGTHLPITFLHDGMAILHVEAIMCVVTQRPVEYGVDYTPPVKEPEPDDYTIQGPVGDVPSDESDEPEKPRLILEP